MKNSLNVLLTIIVITPALFAQDTISKIVRNEPAKNRKISHFERTIVINGMPEDVFAFMDDIRNTGRHMTENSGAMAGSKLHLEWITDHKTGSGTKYRWTGKVAGMKMDFTVEVSKWVEGMEKVWGTVGDAKMIVIDWFEMYLVLAPYENGKTQAQLSIDYTRPEGKFLGFLLAKSYSKWCVKTMVKDTKKHFKKNKKFCKKLHE